MQKPRAFQSLSVLALFLMTAWTLAAEPKQIDPKGQTYDPARMSFFRFDVPVLWGATGHMNEGLTFIYSGVGNEGPEKFYQFGAGFNQDPKDPGKKMTPSAGRLYKSEVEKVFQEARPLS